MSEIKESFIEYLKSKNLHVTRQREVILDAFFHMGQHVSLDEFSSIVSGIDSSIGETTVFRMLKLLVDAGIARELDMGDRIIRYELKAGKNHHDHMICNSCGKCIEIVSSEIEELQQKICDKYGFEMHDHRLEIFGLCNECISEKKQIFKRHNR